MLKRLKTFAFSLVLLTLLLLSACRYQEELPYEYTNITTWGELFDAYWNKMNTNYMFWSIDYNQGKGWDDVYDTYKPKFDELGAIADNVDNHTAWKYLYDITKELSDGHYYLELSNRGSNSPIVFLYPYYVRLMQRLGYTSDEIEYFMDSFDGTEFVAQNEEKYQKFVIYLYEYTRTIVAKTFKQEALVQASETALTSNASGSAITVDGFFTEFYYTLLNTSSASFNAVLGKSANGIVYFSFDSFKFNYMSADSNAGSEVRALLAKYNEFVKDPATKGIIIDLRGNEGGSSDDINLLWAPFSPGVRVDFAKQRTKVGNNRLDYGPWVPVYLNASEGGFDKTKPIVILTNGGTISCAEISVMLFKALKEQHGYDVTIIGDNTAGANGFLLSNESFSGKNEQLTNSGSCAISIYPYITYVYTPSGQVCYHDGTFYEGVGITPDRSVGFDADEFYVNGNDERLKQAIAYLEGRI